MIRLSMLQFRAQAATAAVALAVVRGHTRGHRPAPVRLV